MILDGRAFALEQTSTGEWWVFCVKESRRVAIVEEDGSVYVTETDENDDLLERVAETAGLTIRRDAP